MSATLADDAIGLRELRKPSSASDSNSPVVDIVAVHGLGASADSTWRKYLRNQGRPAPEARSSSYFTKLRDAWQNNKQLEDTQESPYVDWLRDEQMLPAIAPNARIMRYGYESNWFGKDAINTRVSTVAERLLSALKRYREDCPQRPLIFICHCFGGLVVAQALLDARNFSNEWPNIFKSTTGLVFLGTPFRGAEGMRYGVMVEAAQRAFPNDLIQAATLQILQQNSDLLDYIVDAFNKIRSGANQIKTACFWEMKSSNIGKLVGGLDRTEYVVGKSSGCLDQNDFTINRSLSRNHFQMNKFSDADADKEDYSRVEEVIRDMVEIAPTLAEQRLQSSLDSMTHGISTAELSGPMSSLSVTKGPIQRRSAPFSWRVPRSATGRFIGRTVEVNQIKTALTKHHGTGQRRFVLVGLGGMGKSEICLKVIDELRDQFDMVAWIDVNTKDSAITSLADLVKARELQAADLDSAKNALASIPGRHLMILDNADNPEMDYAEIAPPGSEWSVIITSRIRKCRQLATVGDHELQALTPEESANLLLKASDIPTSEWDRQRDAANRVVECLGAHTLAIIQAGAYVSARHCKLAEYPQVFENTQRRQTLLDHALGQERARYRSVWTSFEVTHKSLEAYENAETLNDKQRGADGRRLLEMFSMLHFTEFPLNAFKDAWNEARHVLERAQEAGDFQDVRTLYARGLFRAISARSLSAAKDYVQSTFTQGLAHLLANQIADILPNLKEEWNPDRLHYAFDLLSDLALIQKSATPAGDPTIAMHPLAHSWLRARIDRLESPQTKQQAWTRAGSIIVLCNYSSLTWLNTDIQLRPHVRFYAQHSEQFDISGVDPLVVEQIFSFCAELLLRLREDQGLERFLDQAFERLRAEKRDIPLSLRKIKAKNLYYLTRMSESVNEWSAIVQAEKWTLGRNNPERLRSQHELAQSQQLNGQTKEAFDLLQLVVKRCQEELPEENQIRLNAEHDFADMQQGKDINASIDLFEHVIAVRKRIFSESQPELLISQHQCARTYLFRGDTDEALKRFLNVLEIRKENLSETHPERLASQHEVGCCYREKGEFDKAAELLEDVVRKRKATLRPADMEKCLSQFELALTYYRAGRLLEAIEVLEEIVELQRYLPSTHPNRRGPEIVLQRAKMALDEA